MIALSQLACFPSIWPAIGLLYCEYCRNQPILFIENVAESAIVILRSETYGCDVSLFLSFQLPHHCISLPGRSDSIEGSAAPSQRSFYMMEAMKSNSGWES